MSFLSPLWGSWGKSLCHRGFSSRCSSSGEEMGQRRCGICAGGRKHPPQNGARQTLVLHGPKSCSGRSCERRDPSRVRSAPDRSETSPDQTLRGSDKAAGRAPRDSSSSDTLSQSDTEILSAELHQGTASLEGHEESAACHSQGEHQGQTSLESPLTPQNPQ